MDINDYFAPAPAEPPAAVEAQPEPPAFPAPESHTPEDAPQPEPSGKKEKTVKQQLTSFGITMVVLCFVVSLLAGAGGAFAMMNFYPLLSSDKKGSTEITEGEMYEIPVPGLSESTTAAPEDVPSEENTAEAHSEEPTAAPVNTTKTKGEIYAEAVNAIVGVKAVKYQQIPTFFGRYTTQTVVSTGSGFFVTADGYVVTNYHVIENSTEITVSTYDGASYEATVRGYEESNDIAVLKISGSFEAATLGTSSGLSVGDDILVIGNPLGSLSYTFTDGVVSYLNRMITGDTGATINMFQTNAAINEGNSGGPVYNMQGEVVGIASAKYASSSIEGLGFCIPIDDVIGMIRDIINTGYVTGKPVMGVSVQTVTTAMAIRYGLVEGCYIVEIGADTAADRAGLAASDVIVAVNGTPVYSVAEIPVALMGVKAGSTVDVRVNRGGTELVFSLTLDEYKPGEARTNYANVYDF